MMTLPSYEKWEQQQFGSAHLFLAYGAGNWKVSFIEGGELKRRRRAGSKTHVEITGMVRWGRSWPVRRGLV
jgi:hypothetical protein